MCRLVLLQAEQTAVVGHVLLVKRVLARSRWSLPGIRLQTCYPGGSSLVSAVLLESAFLIKGPRSRRTVDLPVGMVHHSDLLEGCATSFCVRFAQGTSPGDLRCRVC